MKIIIIGGTGTLGKTVVNNFKSRHDLIIAGHSNGDVKVDITDINSIEKMYKHVGSFDAVVSTVGSVKFLPLTKMSNADYEFGLHHKLMGQVNLVLIGLKYINDPGSFTLTSGVLSYDPIPTGSSAAMVNGALNSFVMSAAIEMPKGMRINIVSPTVLEESMQKYETYFPGFVPVPADRAAQAYRKSVEGAQTGQIYEVL